MGQNTCNSDDMGKCGMLVSTHVKVNTSVYPLVIWENVVYFQGLENVWS